MPALVDGVPHFLSRRAAAQLERLAAEFECVWCTGWKERSEEHLPRLLGLPGGWAHVRFSEFPVPDAHWKLAAQSTRTRGPTGRWPGSTTPTTRAAQSGRLPAPDRPCW